MLPGSSPLPADRRLGSSLQGPRASRREVLKLGMGTVVGAAAVSAGLTALPRLGRAAQVAGTTPTAAAATSAETLVGSLFHTLNESQRKLIAFPFDHPLRSKVDNNWHITEQSIGKLLSAEQQDLVRQIFLDIHSPQYAQQVMKQVEHDNEEDGGFPGCSIAMFGEPGAKFEFVFTGRHVTRRCDGNSVEGAAFGGPIFYGHAAQGFNEKPTHPGNIYWYQSLRANHLFQAMDGKQRAIALRNDPRKEKGTRTVALPTPGESLPGLPVAELSADQKGLMREVMADLLAPFRKGDAEEALKLIDDGGFENLHMSFFKNDDLGNDGVWDLWQVEGPAMVWYFRGAPHVHAWVNIREPQTSKA